MAMRYVKWKWKLKQRAAKGIVQISVWTSVVRVVLIEERFDQTWNCQGS